MKKYYRVVRLVIEGKERFDPQYRPWFLPMWEPVKWTYCWSLEEAEQAARDHANRGVVKRLGAL